MLGVYTLLLLWGLATPSLGLLETVGTLARIDKDELGKGEPGAGGQTGRGPLQLPASETDIRAEALSAQLALSAIFCGDPGGASSNTLMPLPLSRELDCVDLPGAGDRHGEGTGWVISPPHVFGVTISGTMQGYPRWGFPTLPSHSSRARLWTSRLGLLLHCPQSLAPLSSPVAG